MISRSVFVWLPEGVESKLQVAPPSADLYARKLTWKPLTPRVIDHAVPSEVQSTAGSLWNASARASGRLDWPQVSPRSEEKNCACVEAPRSFDAAMILPVS